MKIEQVSGRAELLELRERLVQEIGMEVLLHAGLGDETGWTHNTMPTRFSKKDQAGHVTDGGIVAHSHEVADSSIILALAFAGPPTSQNGSHVLHTPDGPRIDLMSTDPAALEGRTGFVHLVSAFGWEPDDSDRVNLSPDASHYRYVYRQGGGVAILGTGLVTVGDLEGHVRQVENPSMEYYKAAA